jgi:hypothetical protein
MHRKKVLALLATGAVIATGTVASGVVGASPAAAANSPVVTRAALDPALVAGRGATVPFAEQEAENAATTGTVMARAGRPTPCPRRRPGGRRSS